MSRAILTCGLFLLALVPFGVAGPVSGPEHLSQKRVGANGNLEIVKEFVAGERACVIAIGDHKPVVPLKITIYDRDNKVVATDEGKETAVEDQPGPADYVAAIWYPPRTGPYRIVIHNSGVEYNDLYIAIK